MSLFRFPHLTNKQTRKTKAGIVRKFRISPKYYLNQLWQNIVPWLSITLLGLLIIVPTTIFIWLLFFTEVFQVQAITVVDARPDTIKQAKTLIEQEITRGPFGKNIFFVQNDSIESTITSQLPQVHSVHVLRKLPGTIKVVIQEKDPVILLQSQGEYYFIDEEGIAYEEASIANLPGIVLPTVKNDDSNSTVNIGIAAVSQEFVDFTKIVEEKLPQVVNANLAEIHIPSLASREVHVKLTNNWLILFDVTRSAVSQLEVLQQLLASTITEDEKNTMQYIDLRIPKRAYYKSNILSE